MAEMGRRLEHYHFPTQLTLFVIGLVAYLWVAPALFPGGPPRWYAAACLLLVVQFGLKRRVRPPSNAPGFPVLPAREK